jgi:hypothetical protein
MCVVDVVLQSRMIHEFLEAVFYWALECGLNFVKNVYGQEMVTNLKLFRKGLWAFVTFLK